MLYQAAKSEALHYIVCLFISAVMIPEGITFAFCSRTFLLCLYYTKKTDILKFFDASDV